MWEDLCQLISQPYYIVDALQRARGGHWLPQHLQSRKQALRKAQAGISQQLERLTDAYWMAIIPLVEYQRRRSELEQKSQVLEAHGSPGRPSSRVGTVGLIDRRFLSSHSSGVWPMPHLSRNAPWWNC